MSFEARVFFPLPPAEANEVSHSSSSPSFNAASSSSTAAASDVSAARPFSLFDHESFLQHCRPEASTAPSPPAGPPERRTDLYLIDPTIAHMERYGLKLRGTSSDAASACSPSSAPALTEYQLELKWRKGVSSAPMGLAENWKKVVKHTTIRAAVPFVARECLPPLQKARDGANLLRKHKVTEGISALIQQLEQRTTASSAAEESGSGASASAASPSAASNERQHAFYVVAVRKQRHVVSQLDGEQTDIEVELLWRGGAHMDAASAAVRSEQRRVFRFRSICFEGSEGATTAKHVQRLFEHLRQRYGDMRNHCGQAQVRADASRAAAAASAVAAPGAASGAMAAFVGGYPEFLMHVLQLVPPASSNAAAAAAASKQ